jgi:hypothetical protein
MLVLLVSKMAHGKRVRFTRLTSLCLLFFALGFAVCSAAVSGVSQVSGISQKDQDIVYVCPMHPEVQSSTPGACPKCEMKLVPQSQVKSPVKTEQKADTIADAYTCPMHPEIRTSTPGVCPKCGMTLVPATPEISGAYQLKMECWPRAVRANERARLRFVFLEPGTGKLVTEFSPTHTKLFHLFIVSQDMSHFQHIHPALEPDSSFTIDAVLPEPGHYKVYSDVYPSRGTPQVLQADLVTAGYKSDLFATEAHLVPDSVLSRTIDGMKIDLKLDPPEIIAGRPFTLSFHLQDVRTGEPVRDLRPYLGAWGHTLILSQDQVDYVHSHPSANVPEVADQSRLKGGPDVVFEAFLPSPGVYRVWTQFQRGDVLSTVSFTIKAVELH